MKETTQIKLSEKDFSHTVEDLLDLFHWQWSHSRPARTKYGWTTALSGKKGEPDYRALRPPRYLLLELKTEEGKLTPEQQEWADLLLACPGIEYHLFRPSDYERIVEILRG